MLNKFFFNHFYYVHHVTCIKILVCALRTCIILHVYHDRYLFRDTCIILHELYLPRDHVRHDVSGCIQVTRHGTAHQGPVGEEVICHQFQVMKVSSTVMVDIKVENVHSVL